MIEFLVGLMVGYIAYRLYADAAFRARMQADAVNVHEKLDALLGKSPKGP